MRRTLCQVLIEPHAVDQILKPRVMANRIKERMYFEELQNVGLLLVGPLKPEECLIVVGKGQIRMNQGPSRNIVFLSALLQFIDQAKRFRAMSSASMCRRQQFDGTWAAVHHRGCPFK